MQDTCGSRAGVVNGQLSQPVRTVHAGMPSMPGPRYPLIPAFTPRPLQSDEEPHKFVA